MKRYSLIPKKVLTIPIPPSINGVNILRSERNLKKLPYHFVESYPNIKNVRSRHRIERVENILRFIFIPPSFHSR